MRYMRAAFLGVMILLLSIPMAFADVVMTPAVSINGEHVATERFVVQKDGVVYIRLVEVFKRLGSEVQWNPANESIETLVAGVKYRFRLNSRQVEVDGLTRSMSNPVLSIDGASYLPLRSVVDVFDGTIALTGDTYAVTLKTDTPGATYEFQTLLKAALAKSLELKQDQSDLERAELVNEVESDDYFSANDEASSIGNDAADLVRYVRLQSLTASRISVESAKIAVRTTEDKIEVDLKNQLEKIIGAEGKKTLLKEEWDLQAEATKQKHLMLEHGLLSQMDYLKAENDLKSKENAYSIQCRELDTLYQTLDDMLGLGKGSYGYLAYAGIDMEPLELGDLEEHIKEVLKNSPQIWSAEQSVKMAELGIDFYVYNAGQDPYDAKSIDLSKAKLAVKQLSEGTDLSLRQIFNQLVQLQDALKTYENELDKAKSDYKLAQLNYSVGLATEIQVSQARFAVSSIEQMITDTTVNYNALYRAFLKPWTAQ